MNITPDEVYITYPVTMPLSLFRKAELAAKYDGRTLNDYIIESIRLDVEDLEDLGELQIPD